MTNGEFFTKHAKKGCIGLVGGIALIDKSIRSAQKKITPDLKPSPFSHAFLFSGKREDDEHWVIESDLEFHRRHTKLGIQENRLSKYFDISQFPNIAVLDFNLNESLTKYIISEALHLLAKNSEYSIREILGVMLSLDKKSRTHTNPLSRENAFFCSAFVQHCYHKADISLRLDVSLKHITPHDIFLTTIPHQQHLLIRQP